MCSALGLACITVDKTHPQKTSPTLNLYSRDGDKQTGKKTNLYLGEFCDVCNGEGVGERFGLKGGVARVFSEEWYLSRFPN